MKAAWIESGAVFTGETPDPEPGKGHALARRR